MIQTSRFILRVLIVVGFTLFGTISYSQPDTLPRRLLVGYWHNWQGSPNSFRLVKISKAYDVVTIAFAVPTTQNGATMRFSPDVSIYPDPQQFTIDIDSLKRRGQKVLIGIGGAADPINVRDSADVQRFISSMRAIISTYGFEGMDIDLEGQSLVIVSGDRDFRNPTSPLIKYFIAAVEGLMSQLPSTFMLTAAPETAFLQGGYTAYGGVWGSYLPVIHALRSRLTYVQTQHYNSGAMRGRDGNYYQPATSDFHVAMADMLLAGFVVDPYGAKIFFPPLLAEQVLIGLPASSSAAGSGYTDPATVQTAINYLTLGKSFGGQYTLANPNGYSGFRGLMTWSINWDTFANSSFSTSYRTYLDTLRPLTELTSPAGVPGGFRLEQNFPNPFNPSTTIQFTLPRRAVVTLDVFDMLGRRVAGLLNGELASGLHRVVFSGSGIASGPYYYRLRSEGGGREQLNEMRKMTVVK